MIDITSKLHDDQTALLLKYDGTISTSILKIIGASTNGTTLVTAETGNGAEHTITLPARSMTIAGLDDLTGLVSKITPLGTYQYFSSSTGDAVGDTRRSNQNGWDILETCITANATRGSGTWTKTKGIISTQLNDSNDLEALGSYIDLPNDLTTNGIININLLHNAGIFQYGSVNIIAVVSGGVRLIMVDNFVMTSRVTGQNHLLIKPNYPPRIVNELGLTTTFIIEYIYGFNQAGG